MSELMNASYGHKSTRWQLLATVSTFALLGSACLAGSAVASDTGDNTVVWIELGGQLERVNDAQTNFAPAFFDNVASHGFISPLDADRPPNYSSALDGSISLTPANSDWVISGAIRYGRSGNNRFLHQQTKPQPFRFKIFGYYTGTAPAAYAQTDAYNSETHMIADFQVGKDVGLGMFGNGGTSTFSAGIRIAQFTERSQATIAARPDVHLHHGSFFGYPVPLFFYHQYFGSFSRWANFRGIGPSLSWNATASLAGSPQANEITFDWGINAAALFGRQKAKTHHQSSGSYHTANGKYHLSSQRLLQTGGGARSHTVVVPNIGGFAGLSFRYDDAKISFGYRADFFFGAMDSGLDARKSYDRNFYGPFASVSFGLGD